jgi:hypothetical protein
MKSAEGEQAVKGFCSTGCGTEPVSYPMSIGTPSPVREASFSPPSSPEDQNAWHYTSAPPYVFMTWYLVKHRDNFIGDRHRTPTVSKVKVKLSLCLTKQHAIKTNGGSEGIAPRILNLHISWLSVVSFTPQSLYPLGNFRRYSLQRRLGGPQSRSGRDASVGNWTLLI